MRHLLVCPEYPPAPHSGGIGTYALHLGNLLADAGETVHVICRNHQGMIAPREVSRNRRLIVHRIPAPFSEISRILGRSAYEPQSFSWEVALFIEKLLVEEQIDLIESQEYEAPLFYYQLRRALGLGAKQSPPCVIHLHSPTELIARYNDWTRHHFDWRFASRLERFSIAAADGLLSPSKHLASYVESEHGVASGTVRIIRHPPGNTQCLKRNEETWKTGSICYVGRLEKRKGILEWITVAVDAAKKHSDLLFEFIGHNKSQETILKFVPDDLRPRFLFRGEQDRSSIEQFLKQARIAVVPSRWENFPYTCIEAMASGLPVIATNNGGMVEMIEDQETGWIARNPGKPGLEEALRRAISTTPAKLAEMGHRAARRIRDVCNNDTIVQDRLSFSKELLNKGATNIDAARVTSHFPEMSPFSCDDASSLMIRFVKEQPATAGKQAAELMRRFKRKLQLPIPANLSQELYRFLAGK